MKERYLKYLPQVMEEMEEFYALALAEDIVLEEEEQGKIAVEQEQWIQTATRKGLERREKMMGISSKAGEDLEEKRQRILYLWNRHGPYTMTTLMEWLDGFCNEKNYLITLGYDRYVLRVVLKLSVKQRRKEVFESLRKMIPANLMLEVLLDYNTHGKLCPLTHGKMKSFPVDYGTIKEMDFFKENQG